MRDPASPKGGNSPNNERPAGPNGVSIPDRQRIDSDVRAFLREPSTPWIVFDQDGRPPSQLAVGEVLTVPRRSLLSVSDASFFPATAIVDAASSSRVEPSSLAVASDLESEDAAASNRDDALDDAVSTPAFARRGPVIGAAAVALVAMLAVGVFALRGVSPDGAPKSVASTELASRSMGVAVPADIPPPDLAAPVVAPAPASAPEEAAASAPSSKSSNEAPAAKASKHGRLSIAGAARSREVFFDGKRLLGHGKRSFTVWCGPHTIAVGKRGDVREIDVPCTMREGVVISK